MRIPLIILAIAAFFAGIFDLPWAYHDSFANWLAPVFNGTLYNDHLHSAGLWVLAITDAVAAVIGVILGWSIWRQGDVNKPALEPDFLFHVWYWDDFYDLVIGRPSQKLATFFAWVVDARVIDGAVNGAAHLVKVTGSATRKLQTGYVRNYALGIALGMAALIIFLLSRTWWS